MVWLFLPHTGAKILDMFNVKCFNAIIYWTINIPWTNTWFRFAGAISFTIHYHSSTICETSIGVGIVILSTHRCIDAGKSMMDKIRSLCFTYLLCLWFYLLWTSKGRTGFIARG